MTAGRAFQRLLDALAALAGAIFALIAILIPVNVALRAGGASLYGLLDAIEYGLFVSAFLAAPWVLSRGGHVTVDIVVAAVPRRAQRALAVATSLIGALACAIFFWFAIEALAASHARGSAIRRAFVIPEWWVLAVPPASMALLTVEFGRQLFAALTGWTVRGRTTEGL